MIAVDSHDGAIFWSAVGFWHPSPNDTRCLVDDIRELKIPLLIYCPLYEYFLQWSLKCDYQTLVINKCERGRIFYSLTIVFIIKNDITAFFSALSLQTKNTFLYPCIKVNIHTNISVEQLDMNCFNLLLCVSLISHYFASYICHILCMQLASCPVCSLHCAVNKTWK